MKNNNFMSGALTLSIGAIIAKIFSAIYRIGLTRILGGEGIGIYQLVFPLYSLCVVLATAGLPMAISKVIATHPNSDKLIIKKCMLFVSIISLTLTFSLILASKGLAILQGLEDIYICYIILAPTIVIVAGSSVLRGYFQGKQNFVPSAVSNILEQLVKLIIGLTLSLALLKISLLASILGAMISIVISEIVSIIVLLIAFVKNKKSNDNIEINTKEILSDIMPITLTNIILPIASFIDSLLVVNLLSINFTRPMAIFMYGLESGAVSSLISLPTIFSFALASVLMPSISNLNKTKSHNLSLAIKIILIITVPCVLAFIFIPDRLINLLYSNRLDSYGVEGLNIAYRLLSISGIGVVFLAINQLYSSSLQAVNLRYTTIRNLLISVAVKFVIELAFMPSVIINIYALSIANTACYLTSMVLNHFEIRETFDLHLNYDFTSKLILSNSILVMILLAILSLTNSWINTIIGIIVAGLVYILSLYKFKIFNNHDIATLKYKVK